MKYKQLEPGIFVSINNDKKKLYFVVKSKNKSQNKIITCLPVINKSDRNEYDRYVCAAYGDMIIVISRPEQIFYHMLHYEKPRMAKHITDTIIEKYNTFDPDKYDIEKQDESTSDGYRAGNPWEGMQMMKRKPKIYKGGK